MNLIKNQTLIHVLQIAFLEFVPKSKKLALLMGNDKPEFITNEKIGSIFGYAMDATDINLDGYSELLVGAPAFYDDDKYEYGAVHIYIGGSLVRIFLYLFRVLATVISDVE